MSLSEDILDCLREQGPAGTETLLHRLKEADTQRVGMALRALRRLEQIERDEFGAWTLTDVAPQPRSAPEPAPEPEPEPEPPRPAPPSPPPPPMPAPRPHPERPFLPGGHYRPASEHDLWPRELQQAHRELTRAEHCRLITLLTRWRTRGPGEAPQLPGASPAMQRAAQGRWEIERSRWQRGVLRGKSVW